MLVSTHLPPMEADTLAPFAQVADNDFCCFRIQAAEF